MAPLMQEMRDGMSGLTTTIAVLLEVRQDPVLGVHHVVVRPNVARVRALLLLPGAQRAILIPKAKAELSGVVPPNHLEKSNPQIDVFVVLLALTTGAGIHWAMMSHLPSSRCRIVPLVGTLMWLEMKSIRQSILDMRKKSTRINQNPVRVDRSWNL